MKQNLAIICALALAACAPVPEHHLTILHVNDTHSHFEPVRSGEEEGLGGIIERAAFVDSVRRADGPENVLLLPDSRNQDSRATCPPGRPSRCP